MSSRYSNRRPSGRRRTSHLLLGLGLFVGLSTFWYNSNRLEATEGTPRDKSKTVQFAKKSPPERCWVFHHLNKAGGSTLKYMFQSWAEAQEDISPALYDSVQWMKGEKFAREFIDEQHAFMMGAYAEGLRPRGGGKGCKWFTVFRHPIPRMVSAYIYCKKGAVDGLCASSVLRANTTDLNTFAEHWGNYALRQFSLAYVLPEDVITAEGGSHRRRALDLMRRHASHTSMRQGAGGMGLGATFSPLSAATASSPLTWLSTPFECIIPFRIPNLCLGSLQYGNYVAVSKIVDEMILFGSSKCSEGILSPIFPML